MNTDNPEFGFVNLLSTEDVVDDARFAVEHGFQWLGVALDWPQNTVLAPPVLTELREISDGSGLRYTMLLSICRQNNYRGPFMLELFPHERILEGRFVCQKMS